MARFKAGEIGLLVATTVIEVGVDVPNASLMVIENAERMGLAQLHQLRGRVGRGTQASSCVLLYHAPLSAHARERLAVLRNTNDGFEVARRDLELRGPGELLGTRQTGLMQLRVADLMRDADLLPRVQAIADVMERAHADNIAAAEAPLDRRRDALREGVTRAIRRDSGRREAAAAGPGASMTFDPPRRTGSGGLARRAWAPDGPAARLLRRANRPRRSISESEAPLAAAESALLQAAGNSRIRARNRADLRRPRLGVRADR